jgi:hypothetical protein
MRCGITDTAVTCERDSASGRGGLAAPARSRSPPAWPWAGGAVGEGSLKIRV